jgi:inosose dehydratase
MILFDGTGRVPKSKVSVHFFLRGEPPALASELIFTLTRGGRMLMHEGMTFTQPLLRTSTRREFLKILSLAAFAGSLAQAATQAQDSSPGRARIPVGSNIYGWSQYYEREGKKVNDHLEEVMSALRDAGYDYLEGFMDVNQPENIARSAEQMRAKGLKPVCIYTGARLHEDGKAQETVQKLLAAAKVCQQAGFSVVDCNPDPIGREKTDAELVVQAKALNELGSGLKRLGLRFGIHNHTPEMANHAREFHQIFRETDPEAVGFCYDVHWVFRGGIAPADCLQQDGARIVSWHLRQSRKGIWWEDLDTGDIDYSAVARYAKEHQMTAPYTVELALENGTAITRSAVENHRRSREFVRRVFGA